jgi:NADH:ubiquinone oxidoreductase subunit K
VTPVTLVVVVAVVAVVEVAAVLQGVFLLVVVAGRHAVGLGLTVTPHTLHTREKLHHLPLTQQTSRPSSRI